MTTIKVLRLPRFEVQVFIRKLLITAVAVSQILVFESVFAQSSDDLNPAGQWTAHQAGAAKTPPMGWNSWNAFRTEIDEEKVKGSAEALVQKGLAKLGYVYVNIDDGWWLKRRQADGKLEIRTAIFPSAAIAGEADTSFKPFVTAIHNMGLKAGIYTDIGRNACSQAWDLHSPNLPIGSVEEREVGLEGHVDQDLKLFFQDWGFDYVKVDACGLADFASDSTVLKKSSYKAREPWILRRNPAADRAQDIRHLYETVSEKLQEYNPDGDYVLSICTWGKGDVRTWGNKVGNVWRTSPDISAKWSSMLRSYDSVAQRALYSRPGSWNDPDMLFVGAGDFDTNHLVEARSHFTLWAMINAPLLIGYDLRTAPKALLDIWGNTDLIAVNQDKLGNQGVLAYRSDEVHIVVKTLSSGNKAVALFNRTNVPQKITLTSEQLKFNTLRSVSLRNLWTKKTLPPFTGKVDLELAAHETLAFEAKGAALLKNGVFVSEIPASVNVAVEGVVFPDSASPIDLQLQTPSPNIQSEIETYARVGSAQADASAYGTEISIAKVPFRYGLGTFANSRLEVLNRNAFKRFSTYVGVDDVSLNRTSKVQFLVYGDGYLLKSSNPIAYGEAPLELNADIRGVKVIELIARVIGEEKVPSVVAWGDAKFLK